MCSLENFLIPRYDILRGIVQDDQKVVRTLKSAANSIIYSDVLKTLVPNINVLRQSSVPQASISLLMVHFPCTAYMKHSKFLEALKTARGIGFDPLKRNLIYALVVLLNTNKTMQDSKFKVYERWGWNHKLALQAFRKFPVFMMLSKETY
uniref:Uncharacterized protein n=1 Tax=Cajanus cajan TaxID=3821 RepID=A0A151RVY6_CAJCA|nr:hypothetical protein KK1_031674 [Cajanus cajan]